MQLWRDRLFALLYTVHSAQNIRIGMSVRYDTYIICRPGNLCRTIIPINNSVEGELGSQTQLLMMTENKFFFEYVKINPLKIRNRMYNMEVIQNIE